MTMSLYPQWVQESHHAASAGCSHASINGLPSSWVNNQLDYAKARSQIERRTSRMEYQQYIVSVGIDIAKKKFDAAFLFGNDTHETGTYENNAVGIQKFISRLKTQRTAETVPCVVESTGLYHVPSALMIRQAGYRVNVINPLITKK